MLSFDHLLELGIDAKRLRGRLAEHRMTSRELADESCVSYWTVCDLLAERTLPTLETRIRIADAVRKHGWDDVIVYPTDAADRS